jgi:hypothetical protein
MHTEDGESVISEVSINTEKRVFNGGILGKNQHKLSKINNNDNFCLNKIDINELDKKLENGKQEKIEPISFRPSTLDVMNNYSIDMEKINLQNECEMEENIFTNLKDKLTDNDKVFVTYNDNTKIKSINSNIINCTISSIEKGIAILVTQDDTIFTLPAFFLPKNSVPGNSYQITIDETIKIHAKVNSIQNIQNKFKTKVK